MAERRTPRALPFVLALIAAVLALSPAAAAAAPSSTGKYYVVSDGSGGQRDSLYTIAARTLGNGNRSQEIFDLNRGRPQPDGGRLTDPLVLKPGWILLLPRDAKGTGVHTGSPPEVAAPPSSAAPSAAPAASPRSGTRGQVLLFGGVSSAFVLLIVVVLAVPKGRRTGPAAAAAPVKADDDAGPPPGEPLVEPVARRPERLTPPAGISASAGPGTPAAPAGPGPPERLAAADWPAARQPIAEGAGVSVEDGLETGRPGAAVSADDRAEPGPPGETEGDRPGSDGRRRPGDREGWPAHDDDYSDASDLPPTVAGPADSGSPGKGDLSKGNAVARSSENTGALPLVDRGDDSRPSAAPPDDPPPGGLTADLVVDGDRVAVSLVGVAGDGPGIAYGWRSAGQAPPVAALPVVLGDQDGRRLHLDLGRCPDVLTVTGALADCEKYALRLVRQLLGNGHGVAVVGDRLFGEALPDGCRRVPTMADVGRLNSSGVVVCGRLTGPDVAAARLSRASGGPTPMSIGEVPRSRWSVQVHSAGDGE